MSSKDDAVDAHFAHAVRNYLLDGGTVERARSLVDLGAKRVAEAKAVGQELMRESPASAVSR